MKVTAVKNMQVLSERGHAYILVKVETDSGIYGLGEAGMRYWGAAIESAVDHLSELVVGQDPFSTERIWQQLWRRSFFPASGAYACAVSAIDIALWDIKGKALEMPVYKLLGGPVRDRVVCYPHNDGQTNSELLGQLQAGGGRRLEVRAVGSARDWKRSLDGGRDRQARARSGPSLWPRSRWPSSGRSWARPFRSVLMYIRGWTQHT